jgi:hypothetical protein
VYEINKLYIISFGGGLKIPLKNQSRCNFCPEPAGQEELNG